MKVNDIDFSFSVRYSLFDILRFAHDLVHTDAQLKRGILHQGENDMVITLSESPGTGNL